MSAPSSRRPLYAAVAALVLCAVPVALATGLLREQQRGAREDETRLLSEQAALRLADFVRARFLALEIVRLETASPAFVADDRFDSIAEATQAQYGGFQAINWIDAEGVIRRVVPREPNLPALGRGLLGHGPTRDAIGSAMRTREPRATPPIQLLQGGRGFGTYFPVVRGGEVHGAINGVFRIDDLIEGCLGDALLERYAVVVEDEGEAVYGDPGSLGGERSETQRVPLLDREWTLRLAPRAPSGGGGTTFSAQSAAIASFLATGSAFSIALAVVAFLVVRRQQVRLDAEREQRRLEAGLAGAQRLEGLGRLAGGVAHDFNNLLAVIQGACEIALRRGGSAPPVVRESLEDALMAAERAAGLTRQLLAFSREQPRVTGRIDLGDVVRTTERMLRRLVREDVELRVSAPEGAIWIESDATQLTQIIVNLVMNASDALAGPGHVHVTLEERDGEAPREPAGRWAVIEVRDDGPGIAPGDLARIFEPFFTTKGAHGGTGLGLATVYGSVQQHGGAVTVESELGAGATFRVFFPLAPARERGEHEGASEGARAPSRRRESLLVLVVEDEELVRRAAVRALEQAGHRVLAAGDGADALALLDGGARPDVVVSDLVMPTMGGLELVRALRERGVTSPAILVSGHADVRLDVEELEALSARFLAKPYATAQLTAAIEEARPAREEEG